MIPRNLHIPSPPSVGGTPTVRMGSQGLQVAYVQNLLNARGVGGRPLWVDGIFGPNTDQRVRTFQGSKMLVIDGIVGPMTLAALEAGPPPISRRPSGVGGAAGGGGGGVTVPATGGV